MRPSKILCCTFVLLGLIPVAAQVDDEQTDDHETQDRRYFERLAEQGRKEEVKEAGPGEREAFIAQAEKLVRDKNFNAASSPRYRVQTDDPRLDPRAIVSLLDSFRQFFEGFWPLDLDLELGEEKARVFLYYSFHKYDQLLEGDWSRSFVRPKGHYQIALDVIVAHTDADVRQDFADSLIHEAAHQLVERGLFGGQRASSWISEGLAGYFGYTLRDETGAFREGVVGGKNTVVVRGAPRGGAVASGLELDLLKTRLNAARGDEVLLTETIVGLDEPQEFYAGDVGLHYAAAWVLVHFMFHGDDGAHRDDFVKYLRLEREGLGGRKMLYVVLGITPPELDAALRAHVKRIKVC